MLPKNKLSKICTDLTLEKAKENIEKECKIVKENTSNVSEYRNHSIKGEESANTILEENKEEEEENSDEEEIRKWREKRLMELKKNKEMKKDGVYIEVSEKDFLPTVLKNHLVICHFYDETFKRCQILHTHLIKLANVHLRTKFIKVEAKKSLFFVNKLNIVVLPSLCLFIGGIHIYTSIGFEEFGNRDNFTTTELEKFLFKKNVLSNMEYSENAEYNEEYDEELNELQKRYFV